VLIAFELSVLQQIAVSSSVNKSQGIKLFIIDWEFAQFGHQAYDLGQFIGDLYERKHFKGVNGAIWAIQGFKNGYGTITDEMAFRTAIHVGVHLICWYTRRAPNSPLPFSLEQITALLKLGRDFVVKGWEKDRHWFENSVLSCLFEKN
jgi:hypothetical protein